MSFSALCTAHPGQVKRAMSKLKSNMSKCIIHRKQGGNHEQAAIAYAFV